MSAATTIYHYCYSTAAADVDVADVVDYCHRLFEIGRCLHCIAMIHLNNVSKYVDLQFFVCMSMKAFKKILFSPTVYNSLPQ